jgi:hypothetical protein
MHYHFQFQINNFQIFHHFYSTKQKEINIQILLEKMRKEDIQCYIKINYLILNSPRITIQLHFKEYHWLYF